MNEVESFDLKALLDEINDFKEEVESMGGEVTVKVVMRFPQGKITIRKHTEKEEQP